VRLSASPRRASGGVDAVELDAPRAFARWLAANRRALGDVLEHGTWLDRDDVNALLDLSIPGIDELLGILEIARLSESDYERIVIDTAPTGHTLRLLAAPDTVAAVAEILDALQEQHRIIRDQLARVGRVEASDRLIAMLAAQARDTAERLRDRRQTTFRWVTLPEAMSLAESEDGVGALEQSGLHVDAIVVNRVLPDGAPCPICDRRRAAERRVVATIRRRLGRGRAVLLVPAQLREPHGQRGLAALGRVMAHGSGLMARGSWRKAEPSAIDRLPSAIDRLPSAISHQPWRGAHSAAPESIAAFQRASLLFFGGKGGVGKTTVSAAAALRIAKADKKRRVLLLSTDPAHSLADVFQATVGDTARRLPRGPRNLEVRELDAARAFAARRVQLEAALDEIAAAFGAGAVSASAGSTPELVKLAPPGIDELFGILSVVDARSAYDLVVVDTAPTGHALRLLEMPDAAREWTQVLMRVLLKYKSLVRPGQLASELVEISKSIRALQALMRDGARTRFIVVTRAAEVPRAETARLLARLRALRLAAPAIVVNALTMSPGRCARCRATAAAERREVSALRRLCRGRCAMIEAPLAAPPPRGARALDEWARRWRQPDSSQGHKGQQRTQREKQEA